MYNFSHGLISVFRHIGTPNKRSQNELSAPKKTVTPLEVLQLSPKLLLQHPQNTVTPYTKIQRPENKQMAPKHYDAPRTNRMLKKICHSSNTLTRQELQDKSNSIQFNAPLHSNGLAMRLVDVFALRHHSQNYLETCIAFINHQILS